MGTDIKAVGNRIKQIRKIRHMTRENLAKKAGITANYLYEVERGSKSATIRVLGNIAATLEVSTDYLIFGKDMYGTNTEDLLGKMISKLSAKQRDSLAQILCIMLQEE